MVEKLERIYTVPLGASYSYVRKKRAKRAVNMLKTFINRHMKAGDRRIVISNTLNNLIWERGIQKPPRKVKVRAIGEVDAVKVYAHDERVEEPKKKAGPEEKKAEPSKAEPVEGGAGPVIPETKRDKQAALEKEKTEPAKEKEEVEKQAEGEGGQEPKAGKKAMPKESKGTTSDVSRKTRESQESPSSKAEKKAELESSDKKEDKE